MNKMIELLECHEHDLRKRQGFIMKTGKIAQFACLIFVLFAIMASVSFDGLSSVLCVISVISLFVQISCTAYNSGVLDGESLEIVKNLKLQEQKENNKNN